MKPIPYSTDDFKPWDFHFAQRIGVLEMALRQVIELAGTHSPAMQESLGKIFQQMDQGVEIANEIAATSTLVNYGQLVMQSLYQDQSVNQAVAQLLHTLGILPRVRQMASPLALPKMAFFDLEADFCHEEPHGAETQPVPGLESWYQNLLWDGYAGKHAQLVKNATIFHPSKTEEHALLISLGQSTALVILLDQPRVQFLHTVRGHANAITLVVSSYSHLQSLYSSKSHAEILEAVKTALTEHLLVNLPPDVVALCKDAAESDPEAVTESEAVTTEHPETLVTAPHLESLSVALKSLWGYDSSEDTALVTVGRKQSCTVRRAQHEQLGKYTSFVLETGEVIFRDNQPDKIYFAMGSRERPELLEDSLNQLPYVSIQLLIEGLTQALAIIQQRPPKEVPAAIELHETPAVPDAPVSDLPDAVV